MWYAPEKNNIDRGGTLTAYGTALILPYKIIFL